MIEHHEQGTRQMSIRRYREKKDSSRGKRRRKLWQEMIESGLIVPNGEFRRNSRGELEPVYVLKEFAPRKQ
jgi:hypothetical protein